MLSRLLGLLLAALLAGCASGPSDSTVEAAIRDRIATGRKGRDVQIKVNSVDVLRCRRSGNDSYTCAFKLDLGIQIAGHGSMAPRVDHARRVGGEIGMVRVANGWSYDPRSDFSMQSF